MTKVKVCGLTTPDDALAAIEAGVEFVGLNFHPPSPRHLPPADARALRALIADSARVVGVFVDLPAQEVKEIAEALSLHAVQLHGQENPDDFRDFGRPLVRAIRVKDESSLSELERWPQAQAFLLDGAGRAGAFGGARFDWSLAEKAAACGRPLWIAGGLDEHNVAEAVRTLRPALVDVASGIESSPGRKDANRMRAFVRAVREVNQS